METMNNDGVTVTVRKVRTPNYKELVAKGLPLPVNPYYMTKRVERRGQIVIHSDYYNGWNPTDSSQLAQMGSVFPDALNKAQDAVSSFIGEMDTVATNVLLKKIQAQTLPILMLYKERKQTGQLVTKFLDDAIFAVRNIKRPHKILERYGYSTRASLLRRGIHLNARQYRKWKKNLRPRKGTSLGNAWLQYRFAWVPGVMDVIDSLNAASSFEKKLHTVKAVKFQRFSSKFAKDTFFDSSSDQSIRASVRGLIKYTVNYHVSDSSLLAAGSLMNIPATLWDSVPWSFVIDRMVDISTYLELQDATIGTEFDDGCKTMFYETLYAPVRDRVDYYPYKFSYTRKSSYVSSAGLTLAMTFLERTKLSTFPKPRLDVPLLYGIKHTVDYLALTAQKLMKRRY